MIIPFDIVQFGLEIYLSITSITSRRWSVRVSNTVSFAHRLRQQRDHSDGGDLRTRVGSLAPLASNASDAGRAKNRRVELVLQ
jgi:hypothetical protein